MSQFKKDDQVVLNTKGPSPIMTVLEVNGSKVKCSWDVSGDTKEEEFNSSQLRYLSPALNQEMAEPVIAQVYIGNKKGKKPRLLNLTQN